MKPPRLSIIIPAYQEASRIEHTLDELAAYLKQHGHHDTDVLVVVATSPDGTARLAEAKAGLFEQFRVVPAGPKVGKGRDVRTGMMEATGEYKLFMDADLATPLHHIEEVRSYMDKGADVIIAVRNLGSSHTGFRRLVSAGGNLLNRIFLRSNVKDSQCGFKAFSKEAAEELFRRQTILGWGFDMEILSIATQLQYEIVTIAAPDWADQPDGTIERGFIGAAFATLAELFLIWWRRTSGRYRHKTYSYKPYQP